jgi:phosphoribosylglycinamide formyltransferase-1
MPQPLRLVALISGGGTTLQNLIDRATAGLLAGEIVGVVSSRADAFGVERARRAGLPVTVIEKGLAGERPRVSGPRGQADTARPADAGPFAERVWAAVRSFSPDLVCLAGWLHLLPIPDDFRLKVLNIHPALLPAFGGKGMYGRHVHEAVLAYGAKVSGCTVHFADDTYDTGPILVQRCVPVKEGDDPDTLAARVFQAECEAYPEAIGLLASGRVTVQGRRVIISG